MIRVLRNEFKINNESRGPLESYPHVITAQVTWPLNTNLHKTSPRSRSRLGEGQVQVRKVRVRSESCELKDLNKDLKDPLPETVFLAFKGSIQVRCIV